MTEKEAEYLDALMGLEVAYAEVLRLEVTRFPESLTARGNGWVRRGETTRITQAGATALGEHKQSAKAAS